MFQKSLIFFEFTSDPSRHYAWADVVVIPSLRPEPFGRVAVEAMSAGCLVIAAKHGGLVEIINDHKTGLFFNPGDAQDLLHKLRWIKNNPTVASEIAQCARLSYEQRFSVDAYKTAVADYLLAVS
jgi:glycosyltransferase involved in cell wall biosynthesis